MAAEPQWSVEYKGPQNNPSPIMNMTKQVEKEKDTKQIFVLERAPVS
jgi:hypothetical protein